MVDSFYQNVTLDSLVSEAKVYQKVFKYLVYRSSLYFTLYGLSITEGVRGKTPADIASEAIEMVFEPNSKFNSARGNLVGYLTFNLIRGKVANLAKKKSSLNEDVSSHHQDWDKNEDNFDTQVDDFVKGILDQIAKATEGDIIAENIFMGKLDGMTRAEIMETFSFDEKQYINGYRRLMTKINSLGLEKYKSQLF